MLATEQECSENTDARSDRIDRVSQREVCEGLQQGIVGFSFFLFFTNPIGSTYNITFSEKQRVKGQSAVQTKSETNFIYQTSFEDINCSEYSNKCDD